MPAWPEDIGWEQITEDYFQSSFMQHSSAETLDKMDSDYVLDHLFETAFFDRDTSYSDRMDARDDVRQYLMDEYGLDIDDVFDWEAWREAYE